MNHTYVLNRTQEITKIKIEKSEEKRSSVSDIRVEEESWQQVVEQLDGLLQESDFKPQIMEFIRTSSFRADSMTDAFAKLMGSLFGKFGLILLDSADPNLRKLEQPFFTSLIMQNDALETAYMNSASDIVGAGYELQADVTAGNANLFYIHEGTRLLLHKKDGIFTDRKGQVSFSRDELLEEVQAHPERFSNNVLTRPLMQDYVLPVLATVLGQGEIAYWAIPRRAFETIGGEMPLIIPRMSFTVVEGTLHKHMDKYQLSFEDVRQGLDHKRQEWLAAQDELGIERRFEETKTSFAAMYEPLIEQLGTVQAGLLKLGNNNKEKILDQITFYRRKPKMQWQNRTKLQSGNGSESSCR